MKFLKKHSGLLYVLLSAVMLLFTLLAYHDMQVAEGVGHYFALKAGNADRVPFDLAADLVRMVGILFFLLLSTVLTGHKGSASFFRLLSVWAALMPMVSMGALVSLTEGFGSELWKITLQESGLAESFWWGELELERLLLIWIPMLCMLAAGLASAGQKVMVRWYKVCFAAAGVLVAVILIFPGLLAVWQFFICYLLLLCCFDMWERLQVCFPQWEYWGLCLFGLMWLRGIYRLWELLSVSHV